MGIERMSMQRNAGHLTLEQSSGMAFRLERDVGMLPFG